jgi:hypothetical protein
MKLLMLSVVVLILLGAGVFLYREQAVPPDCSNIATIDLVRQILIGQFKYPVRVQIANIRTTQGGLFTPRFECEATIEGDLSAQSFLGFEMRAVHYTSEITEDTHRHYVTAQPKALVKKEGSF